MHTFMLRTIATLLSLALAKMQTAYGLWRETHYQKIYTVVNCIHRIVLWYVLRFSIYNRGGPGNRRTRDHSVQKKVQTDLFNRLVPKQRVPIDQGFTLGFSFFLNRNQWNKICCGHRSTIFSWNPSITFLHQLCFEKVWWQRYHLSEPSGWSCSLV